MSVSLVGHISRRTLNIGLAFVVALVVVFFSATRTEVGRERLAREIESQFSARTGATLSIGRLSGNVLRTLRASDVRIEAPDGYPLAFVDSVVVRPRWTSFLRRDISVHRIDLFHPVVRIGTDPSGASLWAFLTSPETVDSTGAPPPASNWRFRNAALGIRGGRLEMAGAPPKLLDLLRFDGVADVDLEAVVDWSDRGRQFDLLSLSALLPASGIKVLEAAMQVVVDAHELTVRRAVVRTG
ncbi:MAG: hypothetical protein O2899_08140, partial [Bacteroidetes bacterium]|nr:hypothetical protein [Bacteroidota bacterium]